MYIHIQQQEFQITSHKKLQQKESEKTLNQRKVLNYSEDQLIPWPLSTTKRRLNYTGLRDLSGPFCLHAQRLR